MIPPGIFFWILVAITAYWLAYAWIAVTLVASLAAGPADVIASATEAMTYVVLALFARGRLP